MIIDSIDTVVYTFQFIVPGYVISEVIGAIMPRKKYSEGERIVQVIGYSVFNMGVWYWLFKLIQNHIDPLSVWYWLINAVAIRRKSCKLTAQGQHYWMLVNKNQI